MMNSASKGQGVQPWVFAVTILSVLLGLVVVYLVWRWMRMPGLRHRLLYDKRRTQYFELERLRPGEAGPGVALPRRGEALGAEGFAAKSGVSPASPRPVWGFARGEP